MGINSHILPGDLLHADEGAQVYTIHPDEIHPAGPINLWEDDDGRLVCNLEENDICLVLAVAPAGSSHGGHAFFVMTQPRVRFGWLINHVVRGYVTQREPSVGFQGRAVDVTSYESWTSLFGQGSSSSRGSDGR